MPEEENVQEENVQEENVQEENIQEPERDYQKPYEHDTITDQNFLDIMNHELNRDPKMSEDEMRALTEELKIDKENYANGTKEDQAAIEAKMIMTGEKMFKPEEFRKTMADLLSDQNKVGHNPTDKLAEYTNDIVGIVDGSVEAVFKDNMPGYEMVDGWKSFEEIDTLIKGRQVDQGSKAGIKALIDDSIRTSENVQEGENSEFNYQKEYNNIKNKVINQGDIRSLATDKIFGDRVFKDDLQSAIQMGTYKDMGLTDKQIKLMDPTKDGRISDEDSVVITSTILEDEDLLKDYLTDYYTKAMEQNWNNNLSPAVRRAMQFKNINLLNPDSGDDNPNIIAALPTITPPTTTPSKSLKGGIVNNSGVFVPTSKLS